MKFYVIGSLIKIIVGVLIIYFTNKNISVKEDFWIGFAFILFGFFVFSWGLSFWFYLVINKFLFKISNYLSYSYKASFLFGMFILINIGLLIFDLWSKYIGLLFLIIFIVLNYLLLKDEKYR